MPNPRLSVLRDNRGYHGSTSFHCYLSSRLGITVTNHGSSPVTWNGYVFSITITATGYTALQIANYINYNVSQEWPGLSGIRGMSWPQMVIESAGGGYETQYGQLMESVGATLKGINIVDSSGNAISGFNRFQADNGTYWYPAAILTASVTGIITGSRLQIYNVTTSTEIYNSVVSGTSYSATFTSGTGYTIGDTVRVRLTYQSGTTAYIPFTNSTVVNSAGWAVLGAQVADSIYNTNAIDGSTVTGLSSDYTHLYIDDTASVSVQEIYAWYQYDLMSSGGIANFFGGITAIDSVNYEIDVGIVNLLLDNTTGSPIQITGGYFYRSDGSVPIASTSGSIQMVSGKAYLATGGALSAGQNAALMIAAYAK